MAQQPMLDRRSLGLKFLLVCALAVLMSIPAFGVFGLIAERTGRAESVVAEIGERLGGEQTVIGPILVAPYRAVTQARDSENRPVQQVETGWYAVFAKTGQGEAVIDTEERHRGTLFKARAYQAALSFSAAFDLTSEPSAPPPNAVIDWSQATLLVGVSDPRGVVEAASVAISGHGDVPFEPGSAYSQVFAGLTAGGSDSSYRPTLANGQMQWLAARVGAIARPGANFTAETHLRVTGVESFSLTAFARTTELIMRGDWPHVGFHGAFATAQPQGEGDDDAQGAANGFSARWSIPFVRRNLADAGPTQSLGGLGGLAVTTRFVDPANPYQAVTRSLKYALLFLGVVFLAYFLMEATSDRRVHPAQYVLVGLAQIIFYLLLLAIAERLGFDLAFLIAAAATVVLIGWYVGSIFQSRQRRYGAIAAFALLYALIYLLMRLEDFALLVGAVAAFIAIAAVMWFTRNLDWYGLGLPDRRPPPPS